MSCEWETQEHCSNTDYYSNPHEIQQARKGEIGHALPDMYFHDQKKSCRFNSCR